MLASCNTAQLSCHLGQSKLRDTTTTVPLSRVATYMHTYSTMRNQCLTLPCKCHGLNNGTICLDVNHLVPQGPLLAELEGEVSFGMLFGIQWVGLMGGAMGKERCPRQRYLCAGIRKQDMRKRKRALQDSSDLNDRWARHKIGCIVRWCRYCFVAYMCNHWSTHLMGTRTVGPVRDPGALAFHMCENTWWAVA